MINLISHWKSSHYTQVFNIYNRQNIYSEKFRVFIKAFTKKTSPLLLKNIFQLLMPFLDTPGIWL